MGKTEENWVRFEYDAEKNIVFIEDHWKIETREDVNDFFGEYQKLTQELGKKFWMVAQVDGLALNPEVADYYGEVARQTVVDHTLGFVRWGTDAVARLTLKTSSMRARMPANMYSSRHQAVQAIEKMQKE